ncbi:MAG: lysine--tRNA ligase [Flavobacteriaceae bacterium]|nr:lysine--tRNA ligase [Cryomorphaceae bacterium]MBL6677806.1 lysine--tRNA ligase [Flavobacteriaceae bacterium]
MFKQYIVTEQEKIRREKLEELKKIGIDPYPAELYPVTNFSLDIVSKYEEKKQVVIAGRIMSRRIQGNASFAEILDSKGRVQVYFNRDEICKGDDKTKYNVVYKRLLDIGDIIGINGELFKTKVGEITVLVKDFKVLNKSLRPLPLPKVDSKGNEYDSFTDLEQRYRQRYVDLIVNPKVKETFVKRTKIINSIRNFLNSREYLEVETPILQPIPGGATARPFITHHNALDIPLYLRISDELFLKKLIVGGFEAVYEFSRDFRNEGMDRNHNPEFTILELYVAYKDYFWMMELTESLIEKVCLEIHNKTKVEFDSKKIDFKAPYERISITDAIIKYTGYDISGKNESELRSICKDLSIDIDNSMGEGKLIDAIFGNKCEKNFINPTFITDYPKSMSPLTKEHRSNSNLTERFELIVNGMEIANAYSELNDPIDQLKRFEDQLELSKKGDDEAMFIDMDFIKSLEYGMPPTSGIGIGIDRLVMLLTNKTSIQEILFFPQMKPIKKEPDISEDAKVIFNRLKNIEQILLADFKSEFDLSNKKWDKILKELRGNDLINIFKSDDDCLFIKPI